MCSHFTRVYSRKWIFEPFVKFILIFCSQTASGLTKLFSIKLNDGTGLRIMSSYGNVTVCAL